MQIARDVLAAVGGAKNVTANDICMTRLRLLTEDPSLIDTEQLSGTSGVLGIVMYYGILLTGGGGLLRGLDQRLREETGVPVNVSPTALENVVNGCAKVLEANALSGGFVQSTGQ